jgi:hypothetical protein
MATTEEKVELVETLKGPRFYRIQLSGYGGESAYMGISKAALEFWSAHTEEHGDNDLVEYMIADDVEDCDFDELDEVPVEAQFLNDADDDMYKRPWYESHTEFEHSHGVEWGSAYLTVTEVESSEYGADIVGDEDVVNREPLQEYLNNLEEANNYEIELTEMGCADDEPDCEAIAQLYSSEKGCFFEGIIETVGEFDPKKLKVYTTEYLNGEDTVSSIEYNGVEVENNGGDTAGKGYSAHVWTNV